MLRRGWPPVSALLSINSHGVAETSNLQARAPKLQQCRGYEGPLAKGYGEELSIMVGWRQCTLGPDHRGHLERPRGAPWLSWWGGQAVSQLHLALLLTC